MSLSISEGTPEPYIGKLVGGRFRIETEVHVTPSTKKMVALDQKKQIPVTLRLLQPPFQTAEVADAVRSACREASQFRDPSIIGTLGVGTMGAEQLFVASEAETGRSLNELIDDDRVVLDVASVLNMASSVSKALERGRVVGCHGAIRPSVLFLDERGNIRIAEFGFSRGLAEASGQNAFDSREHPYLAPEVRMGEAPNVVSDTYGIAAVVSALLTGAAPGPEQQRRAAAYPAGFTALLEQALSPDPEERFETGSQLINALQQMAPTEMQVVRGATASSAEAQEAAHQSGRSPTGEFEVDVDVTSIRPPSQPFPLEAGAPAPASNALASGLGGHPDTGAGEGFDAGRESVASVDLQELLARIDENDAPRWMMVKDNLDHGPFSGRELVELIMRGELLKDNGLVNMDTGRRDPAEAFDDFTEFFHQYELTKQQERQALAMERSEKVEKASNTAKWVIGAGVLAVIAVIATVTMVTLRARDDDSSAKLDARADLFERGEIPITGTAEHLPRRGRRGRPGARRAAGATGGGFSYEEAMNRAVDLGDVSQAGSERQLSGAVVASTMNRHTSQFYGCVAQEIRSGEQISRVQLDLAIAGSGQVLGVSARQGTSRFKQCIAGRVRSIRFPSFPAPRMGARYTFSVN